MEIVRNIFIIIFVVITTTVKGQYFSDVSVSSGVGVSHTSTVFGIGQAWIDVNNDGLLDVYVTDQLGPNHLLINQGNETFVEMPQYDNLKLAAQQCVGISVADYNNDGWDDIYVNCLGNNHLFANNQGQSFQDVTQIAGVEDVNNSQVSAWSDINNDGWLDLYVVNYNDGSLAVEDSFFMSNGDSTFVNISSDLSEINLKKPGLAVTFFDYDNDGDQDLYVVIDRLHGNVLWRNDGSATVACGTYWCFTDVSAATGTDVEVYGMGIATGDIDLDGDMDMYFSSIGNQVLLLSQLSQGSETFIDVSATSILNVTATAGWGTMFFDYDNDSYLDAMIATYGQTTDTSEKLFKGNGDATFSDVTVQAGITDNVYTEGIAYGDYNNDGFLDILKGNRNSGYKLYKNMLSSNNWIEFKLLGALNVNRNAIGSRVSITLSNGKTLIREVTSGDARGAGNQLALHFGLGNNSIISINVNWLGGHDSHISSYAINSLNTISYWGEVKVFVDGFE